MIDDLVNKISQNHLFLQLKNVIEDNTYHDHEDVYSHSIKTKNLALELIDGNFITNSEARADFLKFINKDLNSLKVSETLILIALLHDIGKILYTKEEDKVKPLLVKDPSGNTFCPGHEYWGSVIVGQLLADLSLNKETINYIASVIKLHDTFNENYFATKEDWSMDFLVNDVKARAEGYYKEVLFNVYCDCYFAVPYQNAKKIIVKIFNEQSLYKERLYIIRR